MAVPARKLTREEEAFFFRGNEARKWISNLYRAKSVEVLPGMFTNERYSYWLESLFNKLHKFYLAHEGDDFGQLNTDFDVLLNLAGHPMNPLGVPERIPRPNPPTNDLMRVHSKVCAIFTQGRKEGLSMSLARMSHSGVMYMSHDLEYKASIIRFWVDHYPRIRRAWLEEGPQGLLREAILIAYVVGRRYQYDSMAKLEFTKAGDLLRSFPKERKAATEEGQVLVGDKRLGAGFCPNVWGVRPREVWGMSGTFNYPWQMVVQSYRAAYFERFPHLLHHVSVENAVSTFPAGGVVMSFDFKEFDHSISYPLQLNWINALRDAGVDEALCQMREYATTAPVFFHSGYLSDSQTKHDGVYMMPGLPLGAAHSWDFGVQSGIADVADIDKSVGVAAALDVARRGGVIAEDDILQVMRDEHPRMRLRNMGDDTLLWFASVDEATKFEAACKSYSDFSIKPDARPVFLGNTLVNVASKRVALPNVARGVANIFVPERGISHRLQQGVPRAFWAFGILERNKVYSAHPLWEQIWEICIREASDFLKKDVGRIIAQEAVKQEAEANKMYDHLSVYDKLFLHDPSYIQYRMLPTDVSYDVLQQYYLTVPGEETERFLRQVIN